METLSLLVGSSIDAGTVFAIASTGLLINERAGVINLAAEGTMLMGAIAAFATAVHTGSDAMAFVAAAAAGAAMAAALGFMVIWAHTNQYATGLALSLFGSGLSAFIGMPYTQKQLGARHQFAVPWLADIPWLGNALFKHHPLVYGAAIFAVGVWWFFFRTRRGLIVRAVGESPESAHALGYDVRRVRFLAVLTGGAMTGLAGAYLAVVYTPLWVEGMSAGRGWIALALTTFATWRPGRVLLGAYLFGGVTMLQLHLQGQGVEIPSHLLAMLPYVATITVLALISRNAAWMRANMPASLGRPFSAE